MNDERRDAAERWLRAGHYNARADSLANDFADAIERGEHRK